MKEPVDHIIRPMLPWRGQDAAMTECGYDASKVKTLSREEYSARFKELGRQRMAMLTCMTCMNTAGRWHTWEGDPRDAMRRELEWENHWRTGHGNRLQKELLAIAELIATHPSEFKEALARIEQREQWQQQLKERKADKKTNKQPTF